LNSLTLNNLPGATGVVPGYYTVDLSTTTAASAYDLTSASGLPRWNMSMDGINQSLGGFSNFDLNKAGATQIFAGDLSTTNGTLTLVIPGGFAFDGSSQNLLLSVSFQPNSGTPADPMNAFFPDSLQPNVSSSILFGALFDDNGNYVLDGNGNLQT